METSWFEDYVENPSKREVFIRYSIRVPSRMDEFSINENNLRARQQGNKIEVSFHKKIPQNLLRDLRSFFNISNPEDIPEIIVDRNPSQYIVGYIKDTLPRINEEIIKRKYTEGHLILKTVSIFDIEDVFLNDIENQSFMPILWPMPLPKFSLPTEHDKNPDITYIRDLVSAMTEYFYFNLDECIRKIITSLENYFKHYKLNLLKGVKYPLEIENSNFKKLIFSYVTENFYHYKEDKLSLFRDTLYKIYDIRCQIVHDNLRLKLDNLKLCREAVTTLCYLYQSDFIKKEGLYDYIFSFYTHFDILVTIATGVNLDKLEEAYRLKDESLYSDIGPGEQIKHAFRVSIKKKNPNIDKEEIK